MSIFITYSSRLNLKIRNQLLILFLSLAYMHTPLTIEMTSKVDWSKDKAKLTGKINEILAKIKIDLNHIPVMLNPTAVDNYWAPALTHRTADPVKNLETQEFYGDAALKYAFPMWLRKKFGAMINQKTGTLLLNQYMSTEKQAEFAQKLGLLDYIRYDPGVPGITDTISEDAFESFVGALNNLADDRIMFGMGYFYVSKLLDLIFLDENVDPEKIEKDDVTQLKEIFDKMGYGVPVYNRVNSDKPFLGEFKSEVRGITGKILGIGYGSYKKSKNRAAKNARENLAKEGITLEAADQLKVERAIQSDPEYARQNQRLDLAVKEMNKYYAKNNKVQITQHKLVSPQTGVRNLHSVEFHIGYPGDDNSLKWHIISSVKGADPTQLKINLMKQIADSMGIPA